MTIIETKDYLDSLKGILAYIARDKKSAALAFRKALDIKINNLKEFPFMYKISIYFSSFPPVLGGNAYINPNNKLTRNTLE